LTAAVFRETGGQPLFLFPGKESIMHGNLDTSSTTFAIPARVLRPGEQRATDLLALATEKHAIDPGILAERSPFFWSAEISSDVVDAYYTHMMMNTLTNFMNDAKAGVSFLPGHKHYELPFGRSLDAMLENVAEPPRTRCVADFYTVPGLKLNDVTTDDLISGIRSGLLKEVSVGFYGGRLLCDICGRDFWDWDCPHVPGVQYEIKQDNVVSVKMATFGVDNAHLAEVSAVYDGATPRAEILKAEREAAEGRLRPEAVALLEQRYRMKLPPAKRSFAGVETKERSTMTLEELLQGIREALGVATDEVDVLGVVQSTGEELARLHTVEQSFEAAQKRMKALEGDLQAAQERVKALEPEAADGRQYRSDLISEALAEGVRAYGEKFAQATYETMLRAAPLDVIKQMKADWATVGDQRFAGGRQSTDGGEQAPGKQAEKRRAPAAAHRV
jgi:hypothetical protein